MYQSDKTWKITGRKYCKWTICLCYMRIGDVLYEEKLRKNIQSCFFVGLTLVCLHLKVIVEYDASLFL